MSSIKIVDSHLHLQDFEAGTDIGEIIQDASSLGVAFMACNGTSEESWSTIEQFAERYPQVIPCFGIHPWFIDGCSQGWESRLEEFIKTHKGGVGEIGLDRLRTPYDKESQERAFSAQLRIAKKFGRPAMIHCVKAWGWMQDTLKNESELPDKFLLHSYGGSPDLVKPFADMGAYFSFSGKVLYNNYGRARASIQRIPRERLLVETDAPCMLPPEEYRVKTIPASDGEIYNHPANLPSVVEGVAELLQISTEALREQLWENSSKFFSNISNMEVVP